MVELGTHTGSLVNSIMSESPVVPEVGMGVTILSWTDRNPATIIEVKTAKMIVIQDDDYVRTDKNGMSEDQTYEFSRNPNGPKRTYTLRKNGRWVKKGESMRNGQSISIGKRDRYYDYTF